MELKDLSSFFSYSSNHKLLVYMYATSALFPHEKLESILFHLLKCTIQEAHMIIKFV